MTTATTAADVAHRFNRAFAAHDATGFDDLIADDCVRETAEPAPDGDRYEGRAACLTFWHILIEDRTLQFTAEDITAAGEQATIRWRLRFGAGADDHVRGVTVLTVRDGRIAEALGYSKTPASAGFLPG